MTQTVKEIREAADIHELGLHESLNLGNGLGVMRVPGGWIYSAMVQDSTRVALTATFVPFAGRLMI